MIKIDNKSLRNLEEQVLYDADRIDNLYETSQILSNFGIKIVGSVTTPEELPNPVTYQGDFGDAYLVGTETPYDYYIFTRPFAGEEAPKWFELGPFPKAGPRGAPGRPGTQGATGPRGNIWVWGNIEPTNTVNYKEGDAYFNMTTGDIYTLTNDTDDDNPADNRWELAFNATGPAGATGAVGPRGPVGPVVEIIGILNNIGQLPDPESVARNSAYLVEEGSLRGVYIIITSNGNLVWTRAGYFASGSIVYVAGEPVETFDADTKQDTATTLKTYKIYLSLTNNTTANPTLIWHWQTSSYISLNRGHFYVMCTAPAHQEFTIDVFKKILKSYPIIGEVHCSAFPDGGHTLGIVMNSRYSSTANVLTLNLQNAYYGSQFATVDIPLDDLSISVTKINGW